MERWPEYSAEAQRDLSRAIIWLTQPGSGRKTHRRPATIVAAVNALKRRPCRWRREEGVGRVLIVAGYYVIYRVDADTSLEESSCNVFKLRIPGLGQTF